MVTTAGLIMYKYEPDLKILLICSGSNMGSHQGIPKGHVEHNEDLLNGAIREFNEEVGFMPILSNMYYDLNKVKLKANKELQCQGFEGDLPQGYTFKPNSEISDVQFKSIAECKSVLSNPQFELIRRLQGILNMSDFKKIQSKCVLFESYKKK